MANAHDLLMAQRAAMMAKSGELPADYSQIECVHMDGSTRCFIDTGFYANTTTSRFVGAFAFYRLGVSQGVIGSRNDSTNGACNVFLLSSDSLRLDWPFGVQNISVDIGAKYEIDITRPKVTVNGTTYTGTRTASVDQLSTFLIGSFHDASTSAYTPVVCDCYECWLYSNGDVVRHYIPCVRKSDSAVGFYETVLGDFVTNGGFSEVAA